MIPSSRTPEGSPNRCPTCGHDCIIEPSLSTLDAPCPHCGQLLWFTGAVPVVPLSALNGPRPTRPQIDLPDDFQIPHNVIEVMTASLARENCVLPLGYSCDTLIVAMADPDNFDKIDKLRFIINRNLQIVHVSAEWIRHQIDMRYPDAVSGGTA